MLSTRPGIKENNNLRKFLTGKSGAGHEWLHCLGWLCQGSLSASCVVYIMYEITLSCLDRQRCHQEAGKSYKPVWRKIADHSTSNAAKQKTPVVYPIFRPVHLLIKSTCGTVKPSDCALVPSSGENTARSHVALSMSWPLAVVVRIGNALF